MPDLKVRKIGNSLGVIFPSELVKEKKLRESEIIEEIERIVGRDKLTSTEKEFSRLIYEA